MSPRVLIVAGTLDRKSERTADAIQLALALRHSGPVPLFFSPLTRNINSAAARVLRKATIPVAYDVRDLGRDIEVIHAFDAMGAAIAALAFPSAPLLDATGFALRLPSLMSHLCADIATRDRLIAEGLSPERLVRFPLFVDPVDAPRAAASTLRRALLVSRHASEHHHVVFVANACLEHGIALEVRQVDEGEVSAQPYADYDVVFASSRAALTAVAAGSAVVACDAAGLAGFVTGTNVEQMLGGAFASSTFTRPVSTAAMIEEIARYDQRHAAAATTWVRNHANAAAAMSTLRSCYDQAKLQVPAAGPPHREAAALLQREARTLGDIHSAPALIDDLRLQVEGLAMRCSESHAHAERLRLDLQAREAALVALTAQQLALQTRADAAVAHGLQRDDAVRSLEAQLQTRVDENSDLIAHLRHAAERIAELEQSMKALQTSPVMQLRERIIKMPVLGPLLRRAAKRTMGR